MAQPLRHLQYSRGLKHRKTTRKQGGKWWVTREFPTKINRTAEQPMERVIKRWKRKLPGGSKTWRSWHRMGMLLHTGGGLRGCKCKEDSRKSIIEETGYHKGALLLEWNMFGDIPGHSGSEFMTGRPCDNMQPSWLCEAHWSLLVGKRTNQNFSIKKASLAAVGGADQRGKLFKRGDRWEGYWNKAGLNYGRETKNGHVKTGSPWNVTSSILEYRARLGFERQKWAEVQKSCF